jgi:hypothetical protein
MCDGAMTISPFGVPDTLRGVHASEACVLCKVLWFWILDV